MHTRKIKKERKKNIHVSKQSLSWTTWHQIYTFSIATVTADRENDIFLDWVCDGCDWLHCVHVHIWTKSFENLLNVIAGLCQTHCKQVPEFLRHF